MAPMSVRCEVRSATSAPTSKSSRCTRTPTLASGHGWKEGYLPRPGKTGRRRHMRAIDGGADHLGARKCFSVLRASPLQPLDQVGNGRHPDRQLDEFLGLAGLLAHPGEVEDFQRHWAKSLGRPVSA